jgi:hypothetical protein
MKTTVMFVLFCFWNVISDSEFSQSMHTSMKLFG